jgi:hypothetical protein
MGYNPGLINANIDKTGATINPATSDIQTDGTQKTQIVDSTFNNYDIQNPLPTDGDSIYIKDLDLTHSTKVGWTGNIIDLFDCPNDATGLYNDTATNPKILYVAFCRTLYLNSVGLGCNLTGKTFSNVKIEFIGSDGTVRSTYDDSTNNTKYGTKLYEFAPTACIALKFSFCTTNTDVGLSNLTIQKETAVISRLRALKPNGIINDIDSTYGGGLYTALIDNLGFVGYNTLIGEIRVAEPFRQLGAGFEGTTIDTQYWTTGASGTGATVTQGNCQLLLTSGTANGATVYAYSTRRSRYLSGSSMAFIGVGQLGDTGTVGNKRRWGIGWGASMPAITDGAWFQLEGTEFSVVTCKGGVETKVTSANFNGDLGNYSLSTLANSTEISYINTEIVFSMGGYKLHVVDASVATWTTTMNFHAFADSVNSGALGASVTLAVRTAAIFEMGRPQTQPIKKYQSGTTSGVSCKLGAGNIRGIIISGVTNNAVVNLYDATTAGGTVWWSSGAMTNQTVPMQLPFYDLPFFTGLSFDITGANCNLMVIYE